MRLEVVDKEWGARLNVEPGLLPRVAVFLNNSLYFLYNHPKKFTINEGIDASFL